MGGIYCRYVVCPGNGRDRSRRNLPRVLDHPGRRNNRHIVSGLQRRRIQNKRITREHARRRHQRPQRPPSNYLRISRSPRCDNHKIRVAPEKARYSFCWRKAETHSISRRSSASARLRRRRIPTVSTRKWASALNNCSSMWSITEPAIAPFHRAQTRRRPLRSRLNGMLMRAHATLIPSSSLVC